jgi:pimeloyl-ACP methyl ester carboxylesterase
MFAGAAVWAAAEAPNLVSGLVLMGTHDPDFKDPAAEADWVAERLSAQVRLVQGAGHYPHAEMPEVSGPAVFSFLESLKEKEALVYDA